MEVRDPAAETAVEALVGGHAISTRLTRRCEEDRVVDRAAVLQGKPVGGGQQRTTLKDGLEQKSGERCHNDRAVLRRQLSPEHAPADRVPELRVDQVRH